MEFPDGQIPDWRTDLERAMMIEHQAKRVPFMQLATVREDVSPANRTMVCRGFMEGLDALIFTTDLRSAKVEQAGFPPCWAEACWYVTEAREQYRIGGIVLFVREGTTGVPGDARLQTWSRLTVETRRSFFWPAPGTARVPGSDEPCIAPASLDEPPACFGLLVLEAWNVDHLELEVTPHRRRIYTRDFMRRWSVQEVHP
jgi:pyridoxamine 5'-phosphate oxidase